MCCGLPPFVLLRVDPPGDLPRREACLVQFQRLHHALDQALLVVAVQHLEAFRQPGVLPVQAQQAVGDAVEGAHPHAARLAAELPGDARAHLAGRLVGEGHREDAVHRHAVHLVQPGDAVGQHAGLAGTGAGEDEIVARRGGHGLALGRVQPVEEVGDIHGGILPARRRWSFLRQTMPSARPVRVQRCVAGTRTPPSIMWQSLRRSRIR